MQLKNEHVPVMPREVIKFLKPKKQGFYLDATLGMGGHAKIIASLLGEKGRLIAIDKDIEAIERAKIKLAKYKNKISFFHGNFKDLDIILEKSGIKKVDGILFDLGASTYQLKTSERGFSFREEEENLNAVLDMRMDRSQKISAYNIVNEYQEIELREIFSKLGEEPYPYAKKIAKNIILKRKIKPIKTIKDLLEIIKKSFSSRKYCFGKTKRHYATNIFRAIRMEVNQEQDVLKQAIPKAVNALKKKGRLIIISFHSLEDRIVKQAFKEMSGKTIKLLTKKPVITSSFEVKKNRASDSAKLRAIEKI